MKTIFTLLFLSIYGIFDLSAQNSLEPLILTEQLEIQFSNVEEWETRLIGERFYDEDDNLILVKNSYFFEPNESPNVDKWYQEYDNRGNVILSYHLNPNGANGEPDTLSSVVSTYNDQNQLLSKTNWLEHPLSARIYTYDDNGCLKTVVFENWRDIDQDGIFELEIVAQISYERDKDCNILFQQQFDPCNGQEIKEYTYDANGNLLTKTVFYASLNDNILKLQFEEFYEYDMLDRITEKQVLSYHNDIVVFNTRNIWEYEGEFERFKRYAQQYFDEDLKEWITSHSENRILNLEGEILESLIIGNSFRIGVNEIFTKETINEYNSEGLLMAYEIKETSTLNDVLETSVANKTTYTRRCDGALETVLKENTENFDIHMPDQGLRHSTRRTFVYNKAQDCEEDEWNYSFSIFPNPTENSAIIESELKYAEDTELSIYNSAGMLLRKYSKIEHCGPELYMGDYANGNYFIVLENKRLNERISSKLTVVK